MVDSSFLGSRGPPLKRKRLIFGEESQASTVKDTRITQTQALKLDGKTIEVIVGPEQERASYQVHEAVICASAEFFRNAMKPEWASARPDPRVVELPDDVPAAFSLYMHWIYSKRLPVLPDPKELVTGEGGYHTLAYAYVLGERLMDFEFKNAVQDAYVLYARGSPPTKRYYPTNEEIRIIYDGTRENSPMRKFLADIWTWRGKYEWIEKDRDLPQDFLADVTTALLKTRPPIEDLSRPWKNSHEQYHDH
ncbi:uncharacterized protein BDR25DRAFT_268059 [Lindgomyces ingoldianus]|uniref:Uncharacterized protein n=1 Tax=Lindgomyces ingoldianus TaxID=673940 RepID=A0ACB6QJD4_9PLEO|nr:uncharacterized protein BDR25DRAFT_268059 [Lindgomyces ingoldianus]KAF2466688.1 hypothetical protein BDR25DRAFT_268059 [Lindgomyces ingoldianus]